MPGPSRWRNHTLLASLLSARKLSIDVIDRRVEAVLKLVKRVELANGHFCDQPRPEYTRIDADASMVARQAATQAIVLLKNDQAILPIRNACKRIAVIGPNAKSATYSGGGSAALRPYYLYNIFDGIVASAPAETQINYALGTWAHLTLPVLSSQVTIIDSDNKPGCTLKFWHCTADGIKTGDVIASLDLDICEAKAFGTLPEGVVLPFYAEISSQFNAESTGQYEFGVTVAGRGRLWLDDAMVVDNWTIQRKGTSFFGCGTQEERGVIDVVAGRTYNLRCEFSSIPSPSISDGVFFGRGIVSDSSLN